MASDGARKQFWKRGDSKVPGRIFQGPRDTLQEEGLGASAPTGEESTQAGPRSRSGFLPAWGQQLEDGSERLALWPLDTFDP